MKHLKRLCLLALTLLVWSSAQAGPGKQQLERFLQGLHSLRADFKQTLEDQESGAVYRSSGTFYLQRPGRLRWEYDPPNQQLIVADGKRIWLYDPELEQVSHRSQKAALKGTPAQLLGGEGTVDEHFEIKELGERDGEQWLELIPREKESQFTRLRLALKDHRLEQIEMTDNFGQTSRFVFSHTRRNPPLDPKLFIYRPPPGIDLIGDL